MKTIATLILSASCALSAVAQTTISNGGFENWGGNAAPGIAAEPTGWYSNKSASDIAKAGPQTCFKETTIVHTGTASVKVVTENYIGTAVNGVVTTGVVDAPSLTKTDGYIGTVNYNLATDDRRMSFTGRPDSLTGWYQYVSGGTGEQGKIRAILHTGDYYDPETPTTNHPDPTANKIGDLTFLTPTSSVSTWTRFSMPFTYVSTATPAYIMINITPSANQGTSVSGSTLYLDDLQVAYKVTTPAAINSTELKEEDVTVYAYGKNVCVNFLNENGAGSELVIYDIAGSKICAETIINNKFSSFKLSDLTTGIYIYQLSANGCRKTGKFFIQ